LIDERRFYSISIGIGKESQAMTSFASIVNHAIHRNGRALTIAFALLLATASSLFPQQTFLSE
jgi:hypothetical protein